MPPSDGPVNHRTARTRADIVRAAGALFREHGFDDTPMSAVADAAGVSRRTLYRYFPTKEDIVLESPREWLQLFDSVIETREEGEPTRDLVVRALVRVGAHIAGQRDRIVGELAVLEASATLRGRRGRSDAEWIERYLELLAPDVEPGPDGQLQATVCAMALVAAQRALIAVWAAGPADLDLEVMARRAFAQVDCVWPAGSR